MASRIDEMIEEALRAPDAGIPDDGFCERVLAQLPRTKRVNRMASARYVSLAAAACTGSAATLLLGAPVSSLLSNFIEFGEPAAMLIGALVAAGILVAPVAWLIYREAID